MSDPAPAVASPSARVLSCLVALFVGSGCAALVYELVWFQLLSLTVGSSAISLGVILATFMGGMCLGSLGLARVVSTRPHPLRVYALLEAGIAGLGLLVLWLLPWVGGLYTALGGPGMTGTAIRALVCGLLLLPPTILMGATLPALARWVEGTPRGVSWLGLFYGGNTFGAVLGCLLAGFYLLRVHDVAVATWAAVALNLGAAALAWLLAWGVRYEPLRPAEVAPAPPAPGSGAVLLAIGISGATALGAEVVWTRLLTLLFGGTTYTFSLILAAFLLGIGIGSWGGSALARTLPNPRQAFGWVQLLVVLGLAWAGFLLMRAMPRWPVYPGFSPEPSAMFQLDFLRAALTAFPAALLWGASFPLALAAVASRDQDPGRFVGRVYASNTLGAIVGALSSSLFLIGWLGTQDTQRLMIGLSAVAAALLLVPRWDRAGAAPRLAPGGLVRLAGIAAAALLLGLSIAPVPPLLVGYGRYAFGYTDPAYSNFIYVGEGTNSSVAVSIHANGTKLYHNAGKVQASSDPTDMRITRMLGHLATLVPEKPESVLVIGCGAGVTAGAVSIDPEVNELIIVEIESLVPEVVSELFGAHNHDVIRNPKTRVVIDDGRHYLLTTDRTFDVITSDPFDPWVKGIAALYTLEFWQEVREHLNPGGVVTVWVQFYENTLEAVKSEIATFLEVFPNGLVFANLQQGRGYDVVLLGQVGESTIDLDAIDRRLSRPDHEPLARSLAQVGFGSAAELMATFAARKSDLETWLEGAEINRDRNLRLQFLAGLGVHLQQADRIYRDMIQYRAFPDGLFTGSSERLAALKAAWGK